MKILRYFFGSLWIIFAFALVGCMQHASAKLAGKYASNDDFGVFVFRSDGVVGYKFAAKIDVYSEQNLPPVRGRYRIVGGQIELSGLPADEPKFKLEIRDGGKSLLLTREQPNGTLPDKALYAATPPHVADTKGVGAAKRRFEQSDKSEASRTAYAEALTDILADEVFEHITNGGRNSQIDKLNAELKRLPAPENSDSKQESRLHVGKWQSTRHTYIFRADGTWRFAPEDGTTHGRWHISGNRYFEGDSAYTIILLNRQYFLFTDGQYVFYEYRVSK
jgi:hypothetical protein